MKTIKETIKEFDSWFAKNNILLIPEFAAILKLVIVSMFPASAGMLDKIENKNIADFQIDDVKVKIALKVILNENGYVDMFSRNIATESAESNAPPCAPPQDLVKFNRIKSTLEAILPPIFDNLIDTDETDNHLCSSLKYPDIQRYIIYRLSKKILDYPYLFFNLKFKTDKEFYEFEENVRGEVSRLLSIIRHAGINATQILKNANHAYNIKELSLDTTNLKNSDTGKERNLYDVLPSQSKNPLQILLEAESEKKAEAIINKLSEAEKKQLIADFDKKQIEKKGLLFDIESEASENQIETNIFKYRRKQKTAQPHQLDLFKGGDENE